MIACDAPQELPEIPTISLSCVDCRLGKGWIAVICIETGAVDNLFKWLRRFVICNPYPVRAVERTPYRLGQIGLVGNSGEDESSESDIPPTDWVKSD